MNFIGHIPQTSEHESPNPERRAKVIATAAAKKSALAAGTLALPPGPLGWLTIVPELITVWKIQAQMVADIAALYSKTSGLTREQMFYCLFRHLAAQAVRNLVVQVGERFLVRRVSLQVFQNIAKKIGVRLTQRAFGEGFSRCVPLVGAFGVAAYAYFDTRNVAATAIDLFGHEISIEETPREDHR